MLEIGNQGDFQSDRDMILTHFSKYCLCTLYTVLYTSNPQHNLILRDVSERLHVIAAYWIIIKSNLLLSTLLDELPESILEIVKNKEALAVHQDSWGKQGRRVLSTPPPNALLGPEPTDAILALTRCDATKAAQKWTLDNVTGKLWTTAKSNLAGNTTGTQKWCVGGNSSRYTSNLYHNMISRNNFERLPDYSPVGATGRTCAV